MADTKVQVFGFPKNEELRKAWIRAIARQNFVPSKYSRVCALHFKYDDILRESSYVDTATGRTVSAPLTHHRLHPHAVPSRFPDRPPSPPRKTGKTTAKKPPSSRRTKYNAASTLVALAESADEDTDKISSLKDLVEVVRSLQSAFWHVIENSERLILVHIVESEAPWIKCSVVVKADLALSLYFVKTPVTKFGSNMRVPAFAESKRSVMELLESIEKLAGGSISSPEGQDDLSSSSLQSRDDDTCETIQMLLGRLSVAKMEDRARAIHFLSEQLKLLSMSTRQRSYSAEFIAFCSILFVISPHAYKYLCSCGSIILPHPMTMRSVILSRGMKPPGPNQGETFLCSMVAHISGLDYQERFVAVIVERIHVKPYLEYKGGSTTGIEHGAAEAVDSALVFTVQSLACQFKQVAHVVPVCGCDEHFLHRLFKDVICSLEKIGYRVACVVTDSSPVSKRAMSYFALPPSSAIVYPHPADSARPLFFVVDSLHLLKCICGDWLGQKDEKLCFNFPEFEAKATEERPMLSASFTAVKDTCEYVSKYIDTLTKNALCSSYAQQQSVQLALQVFHQSLVCALQSSPAASHGLQFRVETAGFIKIIVKWWKIVSVKSPYNGNGPRDQFQEALFPSAEDPKVDFLYNFLDWLDAWKAKNLESGTLSENTIAALQQTTHAFLEISRYCFSEVKLPCVLLGKIQTENLEERFGMLGQPAGSSYHASVWHLYESQDELLSWDTLPTVAQDWGTDSNRDEKWEGLEAPEDIPRPSSNFVVTEEALLKIEDMTAVMVYVTACAVNATLKRLDCAKCQPALTTQKAVKLSIAPEHHGLVKEPGQSGLLFPTVFALNAVAHGYIVAEQLSRKPGFLELLSLQHLVTALTVELLINEEFQGFDTCEDGHTSEHVLRHVLWCSTSVWLEDFRRSASKERAGADKAGDGEKQEEQAGIDDSLEGHPGDSSRKKANPVIKLKKRYRMSCEHCEFFSLRHELLTSHYLTSHPEHPLVSCDTCPDRFAHQAFVLVHKAQVHCKLEKGEEGTSLACGLCDASLEGRGALVEHLLQTHAPAAIYGCPECSENFASAADLRSHRSAAHNPQSRQCPHCPKEFRTPWYCRQHIMRSHRNSRLLNACKHCSRRYINLLTLHYHMALSHMHELTDKEKAMLEPLRKRCTQCDYTTFNRRSLVRHVRLDHGSRLQCSQCSSQFFHGWELRRHQRMKHSSVGEQQCPHCPRVLVCPRMYAEHVGMHRDGQGHVCTTCKRLFGSEAVLEHHIKSHTNGSSEVRCQVCLHTFSTRQQLAKHKRKYTETLPDGTTVLKCASEESRAKVRKRRDSGEWKFSCDKCLFRFKFESSLSAHKMSAHQDRPKHGKPFTCQICSKGFRIRFELSAHIRTHTGERPFQCDACGASFTQKATLRDHRVAKHSRAFPHYCPLCAKGFTSKYRLGKHLQVVHPEQPSDAKPAAPRRQPASTKTASSLSAMASESSALPSIVSVYSIPKSEYSAQACSEDLEQVSTLLQPMVLEQVMQEEWLPETTEVSVKVEQTADFAVAENCAVGAEWTVLPSAMPGCGPI